MVVGYLVSLVFLAAVLIVGARYHELPIALILLLLSLPSAIGGAVDGWIAYVRPLQVNCLHDARPQVTSKQPLP